MDPVAQTEAGKDPAKAPTPATDKSAEKGNGHATTEDVQRLINSAVASERRKLEASFEDRLKPLQEKATLAETLQQEITGLREEFKSLQDDLPAGSDSGDPGDPFTAYERELEPPKWAQSKESREAWRNFKRAELRRNSRESALADQIEALTKEVGSFKSAAETAAKEREFERQAKLAMERDSKIKDIAMSLRDEVIDTELLSEWIGNRVTRDQTSGRLIFRLSEDESVPLSRDVVAKNLKPTLRVSAAGAGGSGAGGSKQATSVEMVSSLEARLTELAGALQKSPSNTQLAAEIQKIRREIAKAKAAA